MKVIIEDYNGNDLFTFNSMEWAKINNDVLNAFNCDIADIDTDEEGIKYIRLQVKEEDNE
jgi:hypothetical protein|tara:strand:+ start:399 stop:578 length:180 start_codon:yes stop_codon:yes gene_type:complete